MYNCMNMLFEDLASNSSRTYKIEKLKADRDCKLLREVVRLTLDPFTQFYIRKIPKYTAAKPNQADSLGSVLDSLHNLSTRNVTGNAAVEYLTKLLSSLTEDDAKVIERVIQKDLKCGVNTSTANAVWEGLIHEYPVMLCSPFEQKLVDKIKYPAYVQLKMDGMRFNAIVRDGKVEFRSRNGKEIQLLGHLEEEFVKMAADLPNCVFDGELLVVDDGFVMDRQSGNGILNKANKGTISELEASKVRAVVWDLIPYDRFITGYDCSAYTVRFTLLQKCVLGLNKPEKVSLVNNWEVENYETAKALFEEFLQRGEEGIILKDKAGVWEDKRTKSQIKFKGELECDLKIVGIEEGAGKYAGMLGAIQCESSDGVIKVSVGSGFNDVQRETLGREIVGKIAAIKYNMRIKNKQGEQSLFLPILLEIRDDKEEADSSLQIK